MALMAGWVALITAKPILTGAWAGLLGGAGFVKKDVETARRPYSRKGMIARNTLRLSRVDVKGDRRRRFGAGFLHGHDGGGEKIVAVYGDGGRHHRSATTLTGKMLPTVGGPAATTRLKGYGGPSVQRIIGCDGDEIGIAAGVQGGERRPDPRSRQSARTSLIVPLRWSSDSAFVRAVHAGPHGTVLPDAPALAVTLNGIVSPVETTFSTELSGIGRPRRR